MSIKNGRMLAFLASAAGTQEVTPLLIAPFALLLLAIAMAPIFAGKWWHANYPFVAVGLGAVTVGVYAFVLGNPERYVHVIHEYVSFIALIGSLFVAAGGIHIQVKGESTPSKNAAFLLAGAVVSNILGTTGASMLLIRPWIRMNRYRITAFHIVFFIFIVSNAGGCLTPIGDPPLFLGFLKGVPFWWTLEHAWPAWLICVGLLLVVFLALDADNFRKAPRDVTERMTASETWRFDGLHNLLFIAIILAAVVNNKLLPAYVPEAIMFAAAAGSYFTTPRAVHDANNFTFEPIREVAWLFIGIFATMVPALDYLGLHAQSLGVGDPATLYAATGLLSALLDNAPTYLAFLCALLSLHGLNLDQPADVLLAAGTHTREVLAISLAAVFFGAMTYIGNGPNLMVKAISEHEGAKTPSFPGYVVRYAIPILLPILILIGIVFFSPWRIL